MSHIEKQPEPAEEDAGEWSDEASDPYCGELARQSRSAKPRPATEAEAGGWAGEERREDGVSCYDPYLVSLTRQGREEA